VAVTILLANAGAGVLESVGLVGALIFGVIGILIYFLPAILAFQRNKSSKIAILALNFFLGWSLIGWVVSLVWALTNEQRPVIVQQTFNQGPGEAPQTTFE
jgi:hypothetical protein